MLMTLEESLAYARPLLRWSDAQLHEVAARVVGAATLWAAHWHAGPAFEAGLPALSDAVAVHAEDRTGAARAASWRPCGEASAQGPWWAFEADADPAAVLATALFGAPGAAAAEVGRRAWSDWLAAVDGLCRVAAEDVDGPHGSIEAAWRRWSGAVLVELPWFGARVRLLLLADGVGRLLREPRAVHARRAGVAPRSALAAVAGAPVRLRAQLESFELELGSLVSLRVGDVLHTRHALDRPVQLATAEAADDAPPIGHAWLGRQGDALAVELIRTTAGATR
jgi:hypothetical protein